MRNPLFFFLSPQPLALFLFVVGLAPRHAAHARHSECCGVLWTAVGERISGISQEIARFLCEPGANPVDWRRSGCKSVDWGRIRVQIRLTGKAFPGAVSG